MLRRKKEDVLNLPPKLRSIEYVEMTPKQAQLYREVKDAIVANIDEIALNPNPLAQLIRLRQVTGHPGILSSTITESAKVNRLVELLEEIASSGKKAIVFSNWTDITSRILPALKQYNPAVVIGDTKDVEAEKAKFMQDPSCKVIVGTISKLGTGHTLTAATEVIFMDKPWNLANTEQAEDRAHRIGTTGTVNVRTIVCRDTIDERIEEIIAEKGDLAEALVDGKVSKLRKVELLGRLLA
jgi:SNF2 family DNA or RNA helicase